MKIRCVRAQNWVYYNKLDLNNFKNPLIPCTGGGKDESVRCLKRKGLKVTPPVEERKFRLMVRLKSVMLRILQNTVANQFTIKPGNFNTNTLVL